MGGQALSLSNRRFLHQYKTLIKFHEPFTRHEILRHSGHRKEKSQCGQVSCYSCLRPVMGFLFFFFFSANQVAIEGPVSVHTCRYVNRFKDLRVHKSFVLTYPASSQGALSFLFHYKSYNMFHLFSDHVHWLGPLGVAVFFGTLAARCIYFLYFHPLAKYPGPRLAAVSYLWYARKWLQGRYPWAIEELFETHSCK